MGSKANTRNPSFSATRPQEPSRPKRPPALPSSAVLVSIRQQTDTVALSFSGGKDSLAAWLALSQHRPAFARIIPIYHYDHPKGLRFIEAHLRRLEQHFGTEIIRIPHSRVYQWLAWQSFQPPHAVPIIESYDFPLDTTLTELKRMALADLATADPSLPPDLETAWIAVGTRAADSSLRRLTFSWHGSIRPRDKSFYPVWDWTKARTLQTIADAGLSLPPDYAVWNRSFDGIDYFFLRGLRDHFPRDYKRVKAMLPLIDAEFARYDIWQAEKALAHQAEKEIAKHGSA